MPSTNYKKMAPFGAQLTTQSPQEIRSALLAEGLILIRDFPALQDDELLKLAMEISEKEGGIKDKLLHWDFGPLMKMQFDPEAKNYLFSKERVPYHWDGAFHQEPQFLLFYCQESSDKGGETLFCDTSKIYQDFNEEEKKAAAKVQLSFKTEKLAHYGGEINVPMLQQHPILSSPILRYADEVSTELNPVIREISNDPLELVQKIENQTEKYSYAHVWNPGDLVIVDNFRFIHGRRPLENNISRKFSRIQIL